MEIIATDVNPDMAAMLEGYEYPAILVTADYQILATNSLYRESFGEIELATSPRCYQVSHGYEVPCDRAGENCPLAAAMASGRKERVLHIHQTPRGREHVDVEMLPISGSDGTLRYFVELLKPVSVASAETGEHALVGSSPAFNRMLEAVTRVGPTEASVLLLGQSGTGKELVAKAIHDASPRHHKALVTLECAGLTETLFESELFGHVKGAFTGATYDKRGLVEAANGGTLFLDEIGDVPLEMQVKLLRLIETGTYRPVGAREVRSADFRLVCATHKDMRAMVDRGQFRQDLYFRINVFPIHMPSLGERVSDIPLLAKSILRRLGPEDRYVLTDSAIQLLKSHVYSGNIRELRNILARALVLANTHVIDGHVIRHALDLDLPVDNEGVAPPMAMDEVGVVTLVDLKTQEREYLRKVLAACGGDKEQAAAIAGISLRSLYRKL